MPVDSSSRTVTDTNMSLPSDHLFNSLIDSQELDRASLLFASGLTPPSSLLHRAIVRGVPAAQIVEVIGFFASETALARALDWHDVTGETVHDAALRLGRMDVAEMLKAAGAPVRAAMSVQEDRRSSASLREAIALGKRYKLEPVRTIFRDHV